MIDILKRNNVRIKGKEGKVIMFANGFGCDQNVWRHLIPAFQDSYQLVLFDYVGAGKSDLTAYDPERYSTLDGYAMDVLEIVEALGLSNIILVGHSVSSMIGVRAALKNPDAFDRLIFVCPSPCYLNHPEYYGGMDKADLDGLSQ